MNNPQPKQFLLLRGLPVLMHTMDVFYRYSKGISLILVLPHQQLEPWRNLCHAHGFSIPHKLVTGGPTRFHSVKNALQHIPDEAIVAIHDGVRPLVSLKTIAEAFHLAEKLGNAIPVVKVAESVRMVDGAFNKPINRETLRIIQTPQCFRAKLIKDAYKVTYDESFTDDASVLEKAGERIFLCEGNQENIKLTTPEDMNIAEALLKNTPG